MNALRDELSAAWEAVRARDVKTGTLIAERVGSRRWLRVAKSSEGLAIVVPGGGGAALPDLALEHLKVRFNLACVIESGDVEKVEVLNIVECCDTDPQRAAVFFDVAAGVLPLSEEPSPDELQRVVSALAELFRAVMVAGPKSTLGLWGELFAIAEGDDPELAAAAWHLTPRDRFDFASGNIRVEVKTTTDRRAHHFSLDQLRPPPGVTVIVESIVTNPSPAGPSIRELLDTLASRTSGATRSHLISTSMQSLGSSWPSGAQSRFDADLARATLRFFDSGSVPRVGDPPPDVSAVSFIADLSGADALGITEVRQAGALAAALVPR